VGHRIDVRKLQLFNRISKEGSRQVAESLTQLTGLEAEIAVSKIHFLDLEDLKTHVGDATEVGIHVELTEPPHGYVLFLLDSADSKDLAAEIVPGEASDGDGFSDMECSALQEVGTIMSRLRRRLGERPQDDHRHVDAHVHRRPCQRDHRGDGRVARRGGGVRARLPGRRGRGRRRPDGLSVPAGVS
jgi:hypothetical protein